VGNKLVERQSEKETQEESHKPKDPGNKILLVIVISAWALFYVFMGANGGG